MPLRSGVYIVPTHRWHVERTIWLIPGVVLLTSTAMALLIQPAVDPNSHCRTKRLASGRSRAVMAHIWR